jgi:peptidoglycan/LPS O-acetylase OafA/YrhL
MSHPTHSSAIRYEPAIDGLRAIAVLAVIVFHLDPRWLPGGFTGVDIFFVISGYLITRILLREFDEGTFSIWRFYHRRIARIVPALAFVGFATLLAARFIYDAKHTGAAGISFIMAICSVANLKLWLQGNYFEASHLTQPFLHCWSLSLEEQFYLLYPLLLGIAWRVSRRMVVVVLALVMAASLLACGFVTPRYPVAAFYLLPFRAWELLAGGCLGAMVWRGLDGWRLPGARVLLWAGTLGMIAALGGMREGMGFPGWVAVVPVMATVALIAATALDPDAGAWRWLQAPAMVAIGRLSYALYLTHWPVFSLVDYACCGESAWFRLALKIPITIVATLLLHQVVELPARLRLISEKTVKQEALLLLLGIALVIPSGLTLRAKSYLSASLRDAQRGGVVVNGSGTRGTVALVGDSHANQYALGMAAACRRLGLRLVVLSVDGMQPIPSPTLASPPLWEATRRTLDALHPDVVVMSCNWTVWLGGDRNIVGTVVDELRRFTPRLVLVTTTPFLPTEATREAICRGSRPPFFEDHAEARGRMDVDRWLSSESTDGVEVIPVGPRLVSPTGEFLLENDAGRMVYFDPRHLNEHGTALVLPDIVAALRRALEAKGADPLPVGASR